MASCPELKLVNWSWPTTDKLSELIREQLAMVMVNASTHTQEEQIEVDAEAVGSVDAELKLKLPGEMGHVLVVWYYPKQAWVEAGEWTPVMMRQTNGAN